jgi:hypothetical protein
MKALCPKCTTEEVVIRSLGVKSWQRGLIGDSTQSQELAARAGWK